MQHISIVSSLHSILIGLMMQRIFLPGSEYYLRFECSGNKTEKRSSNPSGVLSRELGRPDMLLISGGTTVLVGEDKVSIIVWIVFNKRVANSDDAAFRPF